MPLLQKKPGHVMSDCWLLEKRREKEVTPTSFVSSKSNKCSILNRAKSGIGILKPEFIREGFKPFVYEGFVSLESSSGQFALRYLEALGLPSPYF